MIERELRMHLFRRTGEAWDMDEQHNGQIGPYFDQQEGKYEGPTGDSCSAGSRL